MLRPALQARERTQRRAGDVRTRWEHLQRGDQRVTPEQRMEAPRVALLHRRRRGVGPTLLGEQLVEPGNAHESSTTTPSPGASDSSPETPEPSRERSVPTSTRPAIPSTVTAPEPRLTATAVPEPRLHAHAPSGAGSVS